MAGKHIGHGHGSGWTKEGSPNILLTVTNMMFLSAQAHYCRVGGRVRGSVRKNLVPPIKRLAGSPENPRRHPVAV